MNILIKISFFGADFHGSQIQKNANSVCGEIKKALEIYLSHPTPLKTCSRTDTGVHAKEFFITFETQKAVVLKKLCHSLNGLLPKSIAVLSAKKAADGFHPQYSAKSKTYEYVISLKPDPFLRERAYFYHKKLNIDLIKEAAAEFIGTHDFSAFCSAHSDIKSKIRTVTSFDIKKRENTVVFTVSADGFLYNMVRIMIGTLIFVNEGKIKKEDIQRIIDEKERKKAGKTVVPDGLYLKKVVY